MTRRAFVSMACAAAVAFAVATPAFAQKGKAHKAKTVSVFKNVETQLQRLELTTDQRQKVDEILAKHKDEAQKASADIRSARKSNDTQALSAGREEMKTVQASVMGEIKPLLTPEQQQKLKHRKKK